VTLTVPEQARERKRGSCQVPIRKCGADGALIKSKPATVYWGWRWPTGDRRSYKQFLCAEHMGPIVLMLKRNRENFQKCYECIGNISPADASVVVWATVFVPGRERLEGYLELHHDCMVELEPQFLREAARLPDRRSGGGAPLPDHERDPWQGLVDALLPGP
jgi:hypothetical protein